MDPTIPGLHCPPNDPQYAQTVGIGAPGKMTLRQGACLSVGSRPLPRMPGRRPAVPAIPPIVNVDIPHRRALPNHLDKARSHSDLRYSSHMLRGTRDPSALGVAPY